MWVSIRCCFLLVWTVGCAVLFEVRFGGVLVCPGKGLAAEWLPVHPVGSSLTAMVAA